MKRHVVVFSGLVFVMAVFWACGGSAFLTGAKVALQENPPNYERALKNLEKAEQQTPDDYEVHKLLAEVYFRRPAVGDAGKTADYEKAEQAFARAAELAPPEKKTDIAKARFAVAQRLLAAQNFEAALRVIENVDVTWEADPGEYYNVGLLYLSLAQEQDDDAVKQSYIDKSCGAFQKGVDQVEPKVQAFMKNAQRDPDAEKELKDMAAQLWSGLGQCKIAKGELDNAIAAYEKAIAYSPDNEMYGKTMKSLQANKGDELIEAGKCDEAIAFYDGLLAEDPQNVDILYYKGKAHLCADDFPSAKAAFDQAVALAPDDLMLLGDLSNIYIQEKKYEAARDVTLKLKEQKPDEPAIIFNLGLICSYAKDWQCVVDNMSQYLSMIDKDDCDAHDFMAAAYRQLGQDDEAVTAAQKAADCREAQ
ncbi:MAG: tetratricopeptide repeat protein [Gemmatimonadetes bacterium]|nr:MAG: tetratricopeptide repeat protein [Gemmatimonadota bacterium]